MNRTFLLIVICCLFFPALLFAGDGRSFSCTYSTYKWNVNSRKAVDLDSIRQPYADLSADEVDPVMGCSVCEEDQEIIDIPPIKPFKVCKKISHILRDVIYDIIDSGETIYKITGYRVGKTRGKTDSNGNRTGFSNHSFGIAIDINPDQNGLYGNCIEFGAECRLIRGGYWLPGQPGTLTSESEVVKLMTDAGFKWGGEIAGKQKDFMHFSLSGY